MKLKAVVKSLSNVIDLEPGTGFNQFVDLMPDIRVIGPVRGIRPDKQYLTDDAPHFRRAHAGVLRDQRNSEAQTFGSILPNGNFLVGPAITVSI